MSTKLLCLAASTTALLWACSASTDDAAPAPAAPPAPTETISTPDSEALAPPAEPSAAPSESEPVRTAEAHVHGNAALAIVVEGSTVTVELDTPLYNVVGFEHEAETDEQIAAVEAAEAALSDPASLFVFNADAGCVALAEGLDVHLEGTHDAHDHDRHDEEAEDAHEHDEHKAHDDHDESSHKDALITYTFECAAPDKLSPINVDMLGKFPNMTELDVVYLGQGKQDLFSLSQSKTEIKLRH